MLAVRVIFQGFPDNSPSAGARSDVVPTLMATRMGIKRCVSSWHKLAIREQARLGKKLEADSQVGFQTWTEHAWFGGTEARTLCPTRTILARFGVMQVQERLASYTWQIIHVLRETYRR